LIWGFWHFPLIVSGYNYPESPVLGAFILFPLTTIFASFFLAWLTIKGQSLWPAVLAHGSVNSFIGAFIGGMEYQNRLAADILVLAFWAIIALLSYHSLTTSIKRRDSDSSQ
jgi:membrane protease YdiL (CAAX protease family)